MESLVPPPYIIGWDGQSNRRFVCSLTPLDGQSYYAQALDIVVDSIPCPMPDVFRWCIEIKGKRPNEFQQVLTQHLASRGVPLAIRNDIVPYICNYTARCEAIGVSVDVISYYSLYVESDEEFDEELDTVTELSMEDSLKPTPASREAVEALEKVMVKGEESETRCVVCLEEFELGLVAKKMPCEHVFHGECIDRWLEKRHVCPLCRFELPFSS